MKIKIKTTNITLNNSIENYLNKKINPLEKFISDFLAQGKDLNNPIEERKGRVEFLVEIGKESGKSKKGLFFTKVIVIIPGEKKVIAHNRSGDLRQSIDVVKDELYVQLASIKKRMVSIAERKTRQAKKEININKDARFYRKGRIREEGL